MVLLLLQLEAYGCDSFDRRVWLSVSVMYHVETVHFFVFGGDGGLLSR